MHFHGSLKKLKLEGRVIQLCVHACFRRFLQESEHLKVYNNIRKLFRREWCIVDLDLTIFSVVKVFFKGAFSGFQSG